MKNLPRAILLGTHFVRDKYYIFFLLTYIVLLFNYLWILHRDLRTEEEIFLRESHICNITPKLLKSKWLHFLINKSVSSLGIPMVTVLYVLGKQSFLHNNFNIFLNHRECWERKSCPQAPSCMDRTCKE